MQWHNVPNILTEHGRYINIDLASSRKADIAVWTYGWAGHTAIVVGPSDKSHFKCVDQNWVGSNQWSGSRAAFVNHNYNGNGGNIYFIRPPYKAEKILLNLAIAQVVQVVQVIRQQTTIKQSQSKETNAHQFHY